MYAVHPELAKEFATKTASIKALPERKGKKKKKLAMPRMHKEMM